MSEEEDQHPDQYEADIQTLLALPEGQRVFWKLISEGGAFSMSYTDGHNNQMIFAEGMRSRANQLMSDIWEFAPEAMFKMMRDNAPKTKEDTEETD